MVHGCYTLKRSSAHWIGVYVRDISNMISVNMHLNESCLSICSSCHSLWFHAVEKYLILFFFFFKLLVGLFFSSSLSECVCVCVQNFLSEIFCVTCFVKREKKSSHKFSSLNIHTQGSCYEDEWGGLCLYGLSSFYCMKYLRTLLSIFTFFFFFYRKHYPLHPLHCCWSCLWVQWNLSVRTTIKFLQPKQEKPGIGGWANQFEGHSGNKMMKLKVVFHIFVTADFKPSLLHLWT